MKAAKFILLLNLIFIGPKAISETCGYLQKTTLYKKTGLKIYKGEVFKSIEYPSNNQYMEILYGSKKAYAKQDSIKPVNVKSCSYLSNACGVFNDNSQVTEDLGQSTNNMGMSQSLDLVSMKKHNGELWFRFDQQGTYIWAQKGQFRLKRGTCDGTTSTNSYTSSSYDSSSYGDTSDYSSGSTDYTNTGSDGYTDTSSYSASDSNSKDDFNPYAIEGETQTNNATSENYSNANSATEYKVNTDSSDGTIQNEAEPGDPTKWSWGQKKAYYGIEIGMTMAIDSEFLSTILTPDCPAGGLSNLIKNTDDDERNICVEPDGLQVQVGPDRIIEKTDKGSGIYGMVYSQFKLTNLLWFAPILHKLGLRLGLGYQQKSIAYTYADNFAAQPAIDLVDLPRKTDELEFNSIVANLGIFFPGQKGKLWINPGIMLRVDYTLKPDFEIDYSHDQAENGIKGADVKIKYKKQQISFFAVPRFEVGYRNFYIGLEMAHTMQYNGVFGIKF